MISILWCCSKSLPTSHFTSYFILLILENIVAYYSYFRHKTMKYSITSHRAGTETTASSTPWRWLIWGEGQIRVKFTFEDKNMKMYNESRIVGFFFDAFFSPSWSPAASEAGYSTAAGRTPDILNKDLPPTALPVNSKGCIIGTLSPTALAVMSRFCLPVAHDCGSSTAL